MVASASNLLQTKLTPPPIRADLVFRPRLARQLSASLERPLTLVCAPAGYGKTTLIAEWLSSAAGGGFRVAWFSLDDDDNDPSRFLSYLVSAFARISDVNLDELLSLLGVPQPPPPKVLLTTLLSQLETFSDPIILVLDDYHLITAAPIHDAVTFFLDHLPTRIHLIITSREDPPFPLARFRGRGLLAEIRVDNLRF
ncbi:partial HTH-type transcriptional regulator MalT, partial [Gammaproteobacteria bacterium]